MSEPEENAPDFPGEVWKTLHSVDCSEHVERKNGLSYLSWSWAWGILMEHYPDSGYRFDDVVYFPDRTAEVWVTISVSDGRRNATRRMWLPVMDYRNSPVIEPTSVDVNRARMRCLTKGLAMFGLGHYIYAGEDVPDAEAEPRRKGVVADVMEVEEIEVNQDVLEHADALAYHSHRKEPEQVKAILDRFRGDHEFKIAVWSKLDSKARSYIKQLEKGNAEQAS